MPVDLHIHTIASDSLWTPAELVQAAKKAGLAAFAVTDHDTDMALDETAEEAKRAEVAFVPGIEFTCLLNGAEVHILGYFMDRDSEALKRLLEKVGQELKRAALKSAQKMRDAGFRLADFKPTGRRHPYMDLVYALLESGEAADASEALELAVGGASPHLVTPWRPEAKDVIDIIRISRGVSSLAHPLYGGRTMATAEREIELLRRMGLDAVEAYSPRQGEEHTEALIALCRKAGLGITGGSDNHGGLLKRRPQGFADVPDWVYEELLALRDAGLSS